MDERTESEILARLDHIERYLAQLGTPSGVRYTPFAADSEAFWGPEWADGTPSGANGVGADIVAMARSGRMIEAIKMYRQQTGVDLKEAKAAVEQAVRGY
jgi:ribosomal protein L7/L12